MGKNTSFYIDTLGCKLNQAESEELCRNFMQKGAFLTTSIQEADCYILNTCAVTQEAERKARQFLRKARTLNPSARICATGCYTKRKPEEIESIGGVAALHKDDLVALISSYLSPSENPYREFLYGSIPRTRTMLKIQEGCNYKCAYCIVPSVKGRELSIPPDQIVDAVKKRAKEGYKEVVITGTRVGSYSYNGYNLKDLLSSILRDASIERIRLSSLQPQEINEDLLSLWKDERLCPHFHVPLQSGSERILQKMGRRYSAADYVRCIDLLREHVPEARITTDIIVGFPEEGDSEFQESLAICHKIDFSKIQVFPFSPRAGTPAAGKGNQVDGKIKKERAAQMLNLSRVLQKKNLERYIGKTCSVLWEKAVDKGLWSGLSESYIRVYCRSLENLRNWISSVKISGLYLDGLWGEIIV